MLEPQRGTGRRGRGPDRIWHGDGRVRGLEHPPRRGDGMAGERARRAAGQPTASKAATTRKVVATAATGLAPAASSVVRIAA